ncbi:hypothetical protein [Senegalia massiliensis]|uniref:Uncharacterized protein n=1 Tax=Senegalia massiliensis TaxID=1720316 RepID=A0A845QSS1_9CLOT|nr:hypothetical protein [Senegalia massiliensis]NBI05867.1 hypothetical protein [Senegalia massiliensis]
MLYTFNTFIIFLGILLILCGIILITRKKFIVNKEYINIFMLIFPMLQIRKMDIEFNFIFFIIYFVVLPALWIVIMIGRGIYVITNTNDQMVVDTLMDILDENGILYEEKKDKIFLKEYDKDISYSESLNTVDINLQSIRDLSFYKEFKIELMSRIKDIDLTVFPSSGVFLIISGFIFIFVIEYM